jgi:hypothetical protein
MDGHGLTQANAADAEPGVSLIDGEFLIVGDEDADPADAEVVEVKGSLLPLAQPGHRAAP